MRFGPPQAECTIYTFKEGLLAAIGHDLAIAVDRFAIEVDGARVEARFDARSLRVITALADGRPFAALSEKDMRTIEHHILEEVLAARRFPEIRCESTAAGEGDTRVLVGALTIHGRQRPLRLPVERRDGRWRARASLSQSDFGIRPYAGMLGALKVRDAIEVEVSLPAP